MHNFAAPEKKFLEEETVDELAAGKDIDEYAEGNRGSALDAGGGHRLPSDRRPEN